MDARRTASGAARQCSFRRDKAAVLLCNSFHSRRCRGPLTASYARRSAWNFSGSRSGGQARTSAR